MPVFPCKHGTCTAYVKRRGDYCAEHADKAPADRREANKRYDLYSRNPEAKRFYASAAWQRARRTALDSGGQLCDLCGRFAEAVHHRIPVAEATAKQRISQPLLQPLCFSCHARIEAEAAAHDGGR